MNDKVDKILDQAYALIVVEMNKAGIKCDSVTSDGCIFYDDTEGKKTYCINITRNECAEYEGE